MKDNNKDFFIQEASRQVFIDKYMFRGEKDVFHVFDEVSKEISSCEEESVKEYWRKAFYDELSSARLIPAGRIISNARSDEFFDDLRKRFPDKKITHMKNYNNCFTIPIDDSMEGIYETVKNHALISKQGGGVGINFSNLRPKGSDLSVGGAASGVLSFMKVFDQSSKVIMTGGQRRCLPHYTNVTTDKGLVPISEVKKGYKVLIEDGTYHKVTNIFHQGDQKIIRIPLETGEFFECTPNHRMPIIPKDGCKTGRYDWVQAKEILPGDALVNVYTNEFDRVTYKPVKVIDFSFYLRNDDGETVFVETYDIEVDTAHRFIANGYLTHNSANMGLLDVSHPDIEEFITAKHGSENGVLTMYNISVIVTDAFIEAVDNDADWDLVFNGVVYKTIKAKYLYDLISHNAFEHNEPGIFCADTVERFNNGHGDFKMDVVNPCLTYDTLVAVADGRNAVPIGKLAEEGKDVPVYCLDDAGKTVIKMMRNPRVTGYDQKIYKVTLDDGSTVECTGNHKFRLLDGSYKEATELVAGESLYHNTKVELKWEQMFKGSNSKSKRYTLVNDPNSSRRFEHQMIYEFYHGITIPTGYVIHHIDFDPSNNEIENLQMMTKAEHDALHGELMKGENNPYHQMTDEWKKDFATHKGAENGKFIDISNEDLQQKMVEWVIENKRAIGPTEWEPYAKENGLPAFSTTYRGNITNYFNKANVLGGIFEEEVSGYAKRTYNLYLSLLESTDLELRWVDNAIYVEKECEHCGEKMLFPYQEREKSMCPKCSQAKYAERLQKAAIVKEFCLKGDALRANNKMKAHMIFRKFVMVFERVPTLTEMLPLLKAMGVADLRSCGLRYNTFIESVSAVYRVEMNVSRLINDPQYRVWKAKDLLNAGMVYNFKVVSVEEVGEGTVYNGTVDQYHNFNIVMKYGINPQTGGKRMEWCNNLQCGELVMPNNSLCCLSAINLAMFVVNPFTPEAYFDYEAFGKTVGIGIRFLDDVLSTTNYPLQVIEDFSELWRRIGLGYTGLANAMAMLRMRYGSPESIEFTGEMSKALRDNSYFNSSLIAKEKGPFPSYDYEKFINQNFVKALPEYIKKSIKENGCRNIQMNTVAPTGTTSFSVGNYCSSGIEPVFGYGFKRNITNADGVTFTEVNVFDYGLKRYREFIGAGDDEEIELPDYFILNDAIPPKESIDIQAACQKYIDHSISKCIDADTVLNTNWGSVKIKNMVELEEGEELIPDTYYGLNKDYTIYDTDGVKQKILSFYYNGRADGLQIRFEDKKTGYLSIVDCSLVHQWELFGTGEMVQAQNLKEGDRISFIGDGLQKKTFVEVTGITESEDLDLMEISVEGSSTYNIHGVVCHNTLNIAPGTSFEEYQGLFHYAYKKGLKGFTTFNPDGSMQGILGGDMNKGKAVANVVKVRPDKIKCDVYNIKQKNQNYKILVGIHEEKPYEIFFVEDISEDLDIKGFEPVEGGTFISKRKDETGRTVYSLKTEYTDGTNVIETVLSDITRKHSVNSSLARFVSMAMRYNTPIPVVVKQMGKDSNFSDFEKSVSLVLKGYISEGAEVVNEIGDKLTCPECHEESMRYVEGCMTCSKCGWSKCG